MTQHNQNNKKHHLNELINELTGDSVDEVKVQKLIEKSNLQLSPDPLLRLNELLCLLHEQIEGPHV